MTDDEAIEEIREALAKARNQHGDMHSPHEGHSVIREELDELWDHVRADTGRSLGARHEAAQVGAMAARYIVDLTSISSGTREERARSAGRA